MIPLGNVQVTSGSKLETFLPQISYISFSQTPGALFSFWDPLVLAEGGLGGGVLMPAVFGGSPVQVPRDTLRSVGLGTHTDFKSVRESD